MPRVLTLRTHVAAVLLALLIATLVSCGGSNAKRATLTDADCTYDGSKTPGRGRLAVDLANDSSFPMAFVLAQTAGGIPVSGIDDWLTAVKREYDRTGTILPAPVPWNTVATVPLAPDLTGLLQADLAAGRYILMCFVSDPANRNEPANEPVPPGEIRVAADLLVD